MLRRTTGPWFVHSQVSGYGEQLWLEETVLIVVESYARLEEKLSLTKALNFMIGQKKSECREKGEFK